MRPRMLVFDMDGVLVDAAASYREAIRATVEHFTGRRVTSELIQEYKNRGGWNNDWALSQRILRDLGMEVAYETVVAQFQHVFLGTNGDGLLWRERWIPEEGLLERLSRRYRLAIFTGRIRPELEITLARFATTVRFDPTVCTGEIENTKPAPDGLEKIARLCPEVEILYIGDNVDDARCAATAGVRFIGVADPRGPRGGELAALFRAEGAIAVIESVNQLEAALAP